MNIGAALTSMQAAGATSGSQLAGKAASLGSSLIPSADKHGNVNRAGMTASSALSGASMGAALGPIGMAAGAVIGGAVGFIKSGKMKKEQEAEERLLADVERKNFMESSRSIVASYPRSGVNVSGFYKNGGDIIPPREINQFRGNSFYKDQFFADDHPNRFVNGKDTKNSFRQGGNIKLNGSTLDRFDSKGGRLVPIAENVSIAKGKTHEQGGIDLYDQGKHFAEIENDEVIHGTRVFSDTLKVPEYVFEAFKNSKQKKK